jgi:hypothetical protein
MTTEDPNINWLKDGLARIEKTVTKLSDKLDMYIDRFQTKDDAGNEYRRLEQHIATKADKEDVQKIQESITWTARLIIGAVILAVLSLIGLNI